MKSGRAFPYLLIAPAVVTLSLTTLLPLCFTLIYSFQSLRLSPSGTQAQFVGLENYAATLRDKEFWHALRNTLVFVVLAVPLQMTIGFALALLLDRVFRAAGLVRSILLLPVMLSPVVVAVIWRMFFNADVGLVNYLLNFIGVDKQAWLGQPWLAMASLVVCDVWHWAPYCMLLTLAGLQALPGEVYEAARIDGTRAWQRLIYITLPMLRPILVVVFLFRGLEAFIVFDKVYILTGGGPGAATETLSMYVYKTGLKYLHLGQASAMAFVMFAMVLAASFWFIRSVSRRTA